MQIAVGALNKFHIIRAPRCKCNIHRTRSGHKQICELYGFSSIERKLYLGMNFITFHFISFYFMFTLYNQKKKKKQTQKKVLETNY